MAKGVVEFLKDKGKQLLIPWVLAVLVLVPLLMYSKPDLPAVLEVLAVVPGQLRDATQLSSEHPNEPAGLLVSLTAVRLLRGGDFAVAV